MIMRHCTTNISKTLILTSLTSTTSMTLIQTLTTTPTMAPTTVATTRITVLFQMVLTKYTLYLPPVLM